MSGDSHSLSWSTWGQGSAVLGVLAFSCGVILLYWLPVLPAPAWAVASFVAAYFLALRTSRVQLRWLCLALAFCSLGMTWASWQAEARLAERLPASLQGERVSVSGYLCDPPAIGSFNSLRFSFCVTRWHRAGGPVGKLSPAIQLPSRLRLAWYRPVPAELAHHSLRLEVVLKQPRGTVNPVGFRYEDWLFRQGYGATGRVYTVQPDPTEPCRLNCLYQKQHLALINWVEDRFSQSEHWPLVSALLVGYRGHMTDQHWRVLRATGTVHLVAISGLHLGLIAVAAGFIGRKLLLQLPGNWASERTRRRLLFALVAVCCLVYALAAGFTVPTRRALVMVVFAGWALLCAREVSVWRSLLMAAAVVLAFDPLAPLDQGFWLSFVAVALLLSVLSGRLRAPGWMIGLLLSQAAIFAGLWPVLESFGQGQPVAGAVANLLAIPWVSLVVMPVLVLGALAAWLVPSIAAPVCWVFDWVLELLWWLLSELARWEAPAFDPQLPEILLLAPLVLCLLCLPFRGFRAVAGVALVLWLGLSQRETAALNPDVLRPEMRVWDVGQGLAVLIRHRREVVLYDTGPGWGSYSAVESTLLPNLRALNVRKIDLLVVSHADNDHSSGLAELVRALPVERVISGEPAAVGRKLGQVGGLEVLPCRRMTERLAGLDLTYWQDLQAEGNDASCVVRVQHKASRTEFLLPGDITARVEAHYLDQLAVEGSGAPASLRVIVAPHHGSRTSSSARWVNELTPHYVIFSAGHLHRFGHPHASVVTRYRGVGARLLSTACSGALTLTIGEGELAVTQARLEASFWVGGNRLARHECELP